MRFLILTILMPCLGLCQAQTIDSVAIKKQADSLLQVSRALVDKHDFDKVLEVNAAAERLAIVNFGLIYAFGTPLPPNWN